MSTLRRMEIRARRESLQSDNVAIRICEFSYKDGVRELAIAEPPGQPRA